MHGLSKQHAMSPRMHPKPQSKLLAAEEGSHDLPCTVPRVSDPHGGFPKTAGSLGIVGECHPERTKSVVIRWLFSWGQNARRIRASLLRGFPAAASPACVHELAMRAYRSIMTTYPACPACGPCQADDRISCFFGGYFLSFNKGDKQHSTDLGWQAGDKISRTPKT